ncbi:nuclear transport factor 2 family protein [Rhizobiaceae bacterium n13]|uniref:Nuclear transport factor 2 family protein n=1 Tax=Ferirhizobium litorale TaxID=2927786 RepID=A0AAE3QCN1_9HYPH|nr:nuclear transport factor 2 family protein [Fererhizobium litorale]MDI7860783.1 nuclear transport factor 2 family protein [Fererhizobium litorale]MDI7920931.1 nuclear transport factor 2 family protein [Fererhizobium litorale]
MTTLLPDAVAAYFAAKNKQDIDAMLATFAPDASVRDEGQDMRGAEQIRTWMEKTTAKYRVSVEIRETQFDGNQLNVVGLVSGNFPGSPAILRYVFTLRDGAIVHLEIGA